MARSYTKQEYEYHGKMLKMKELQEFSQCDATTIKRRIQLGWPVDLAVETPSLRSGDKNLHPACGAKSFWDCFKCRYPDCIIALPVIFEDDPTTHDVFFVAWRGQGACV